MSTDTLNLPVSFAGVSIGEGTARVGCKAPRDLLTLVRADEILCGHRLIGRIVQCKSNEAANQTAFLDGTKHEIPGSFDVKGFRVTPDDICFGLTFSLRDVKVEELPHFAKKSGRLIVEMVTAIPEDTKPSKAGEGDPEEDDEDDDEGDE